MTHAIDIYKATHGIDESMQGLSAFEGAHLKSDFVKRIADYNADRLMLPEGIDAYQAEDWLLGRAVANMLYNKRSNSLSLPESTNGERVGEPRFRIDAYDGTSVRVS